MGRRSWIRLAACAARAIAKAAYRGLVGDRPDDPMKAWRGTAENDQHALSVLHVGDCGVRRMDGAHDLLGQPGYPVVTAHELLRRGIPVEFSHYFCVSFEDLPEVARLQGHLLLSGQPDVVLVQIGAAYTRKIILPDRARVHQLRDELARHAPGLVVPLYGLLRPCLRGFGRHSASYRGSGGLKRFIDEVRAMWPAVHVVLVTPFRRSPGYASGEPVARRIEKDLLMLARLPGVSVFDANGVLGRDPRLRCVTGYNLNGRGCELVGMELAGWIRARLDDSHLAAESSSPVLLSGRAVAGHESLPAPFTESAR